MKIIKLLLCCTLICSYNARAEMSADNAAKLAALIKKRDDIIKTNPAQKNS